MPEWCTGIPVLAHLVAIVMPCMAAVSFAFAYFARVCVCVCEHKWLWHPPGSSKFMAGTCVYILCSFTTTATLPALASAE